jgi:hypothetical protein
VPRELFGVGFAALVYFGLAVLYFLPAFLPMAHIYGSDYFAAGYFSHEFISERLAAGELPKWVPYVYGGVPMFANPGSTFYPVRWLADLIFPVSKIYPTMFVVQFALAGLGSYLLARELGARRWIAFVAGLAFQFTGLTMSYVLAGHDGRIIVATFAPLLFFFLHRGVRTGELAPFVGAAATVGFALLSFQIQSAYYLLLGGAIWAVFCLLHHRLHRTPVVLGKRVALGLGAVAFGFALAAVNFLPFMDYVERSPRGAVEGRGYEYSTSWSMEPRELVGIAVPEQAGVLEHYQGANAFKLHTEYVGAPVVALLILGFAYARRDKRWWFFLGLSVFVLTIAFGGHTPVYRIWYELLPGTKRFRAPSISFFLVSMSLVAMAAITLESMAARLDVRWMQPARGGEAQAALPRFGSGLLAIAALAAVGLVAASAGGDGSARAAARVAGWLRFAIFLGAVLGLLWAWSRRALTPTALALALATLTVVDLWIIDRRFFETRDAPEDTFAADGVVGFLRSQPQPSRVWVLPLGGGAGYRREANYLMRFDIAQAGGEHGNQLQRYNEFVGAGEQTYVDWHNFLAGLVDPNRADMLKFLDAANVRYLIAGVPLGGSPFPVVYNGPDGVVLENPNALPRAWLVGQTMTVPEGSEIDWMSAPTFDFRTTALVDEPLATPLPAAQVDGSAEIVGYEPDRVLVRTSASSDALLVLADTWYPDWRVTVDGADARLYRTNHAFRGVRVPAGTHEVEFVFAPPALRLGFFIWLAGLALLAAYAVWHVVRRRRTASAAPAPAA